MKEGYETYSEAFAAYLESDHCDPAVKEIVQLAKRRHDKQLEKKMRQRNKQSNLDQNKAHFEKSVEDEVPLFDGGDSFDWNQHAIDSLGFQWNENVKTWLDNISNETEEQLLEYADNLNLPEINLLYANPLQRVIISMNIRKLLEVARKGIGNVY